MAKSWSRVLVSLAVFVPSILALSSLTELSFDEFDRLTHNYLFYTDTALCKKTFSELDYRIGMPLSAELAGEYFGADATSCSAVCVQRGTHKDHVMHPLPMHVGTNLMNVYNFAFENCQKAEVGFLSYNHNLANLLWVNQHNRRVKVGTLKYGEKNTVWQVSYLGHRFVVEDSITKETLLELTVEYDSVFPIGNHTSALQVRDVARGVQETFKMEWNRAHRVSRTFTEFGFNKGRLPHDLWSSISGYYHNNRDHKVIEEWDSKGLYVNWWETDVFFIPMPWELKKVWQARIKKLVEAWTGVDLETTDIYGMRRYEDGARLLTHVDRESTHAASIIMNIAQGGVRTPWKVEIYDFANRLHEIEMDPGDIVYYESARCLHGRMRPLDGAYYVNLFAHYRPDGDPNWFTKQNPPGTAKQVLELGHCTSDGTKASCDGHDAPYLSPSLDRLEGPEDLFRFWRDTAPLVAPTRSSVKASAVRDEL